jgi:hypothetical protein
MVNVMSASTVPGSTAAEVSDKATTARYAVALMLFVTVVINYICARTCQWLHR